MLPKIAEFFGTTIDELFRENMVAYRNKAEHLYSIYQNCPSPENFAAAESALIKITESPTSPDCYFRTVAYAELGEKSNAYTTWKEIAERLGKMGFSIEKEYAVKKMQEFG